MEYVVLAFARGLEGGLDSSKSAHLNRVVPTTRAQPRVVRVALMVKFKDDDDDDKYMRKNSGRREEWDQWSLDYLDRVDGKGSDEASWASRFLGTDVTIGLSAAQMKKRVQDNREAVADLIKHQESEDLKQVIRDAAKNRPAPVRSNARLAWQALETSCQIPMTVLQIQAKIRE